MVGAVSGPVGTEDTTAATIEITPSREAEVGGARVRRALPRRGRRTVGAWCFADHMGPGAGVDVGPHPHIGLQTVTWLVEGEILHRDSLGSEQPIRPGQLNLMTAGRGVSHSEETIGDGPVHGIQLWVAQTDATRNGEPAFEHRASLPQREIGDGVATVLVDEPGHVGLDLDLRGTATVELDPGCEHALVVLDGAVRVCEGVTVEPGVLAHLGLGRAGLELDGTARVVLLGGTPFPEEIVMWWNFVGRSRDEVAQAGEEWNAHHERFGHVASPIGRIPAPTPHWRTT